MAADLPDADRASAESVTAENATAEAVDAAAARVAGWIAALRPEVDAEPDPQGSRGATADLLEGARRDAGGVAFTRRLLEAVIGASDPFAAALGLRAVSHDLPPSLPAKDRLAVRAGGIASLGLPWAVLPVARRWLRDRVAHLVLAVKLPSDKDPVPIALHAALRGNTEAGFETLLALGGETVLGPSGAAREIERLTRLACDPEVTHLAVDPARIAPAITATGTGGWSLDADAERGAAILRTVLAAARDHGTTVLLEPSDYRGALLAPELLIRALSGPDAPDAPELAGVRTGVRLPAELPESRDAAELLIRYSRERVARGGEALELVVGVAGLSGQAQVDALLSGLSVPVLDGREAALAQSLRLIETVLAAGPAARAVIATEDPMLLAAATLAAERFGARLGLQLRAGVATPLAIALAEHGFPVRLRLPLFAPKELASAVEGLVHLAIEAADAESPLARATDLGARDAGLAELRVAYAPVVSAADRPFPPSHRTQLRGREWDPVEREGAFFYRAPTDSERLDTGGLTAAVLGLGRDATGQIVVDPSGPVRRIPVISESGFACEPDTDASRPQNRAWARGVLTRANLLRASWAAQGSMVRGEGEDLLAAAGPAGASDVAEAWRAQRAGERATRIGRLALGVASARDRLLAVLAAESGAPISALDAEISSAVDAARYLGLLAGGLGAVRGAEFQADRLALVVADASASFSERAEAVLAALAAGSAVVLVAHTSVARSSAALIEEWEAAGLPSGMVALAVAPPVRAAHAAGRTNRHADFAARLATDRRFDRALVIGERDTARALIRHRPDLRVEGRLRTLGSTLITTGADPAEAVRDAVRSAFGGAAPSRTARALVLLGGTGRAKRVRRLLADAVAGLRVGDSAASGAAGPGGAAASSASAPSPGDTDPLGSADPLAFDFGPLPAAPDAEGLRALTELEPGEEWLVEPRQLDDEGRLWRPGVRIGVRREARFWADAVGMPVIGVIAAGSLAEALDLQNELGGGSVAALHALDPAETLPWLDGVRAAALAINRPTTAARIGQQPAGGWDAAGMGGHPLAGGPNRLVALGSWQLREGTPSSTLHLRGLSPEVQSLIETAQASLDYAGFDRVRRAALADALSWRTSLGRLRDDAGLGVERNLLRHWPVSTHVRLAEGGALDELLRVIAAGLLVGAPMSVSTGLLLPADVVSFLEGLQIVVSLERDDAWLERIAVVGAGPGAGAIAERVRLIGGDAVRAAEWLGGQDRVPLWSEPVTMAGPVELLVFLREQSISIAAHRYGFTSPLPGIEDRISELDAMMTVSE